MPERKAEWDNRHFWRVSNAEHLEMSENVGMINLSHFAIYDVSGPDAESLMEYVCVAKVGGDTPVGKGIYTHFLDHAGGVRADLTVLRLAGDRYRVMDGGDAGNRDYVWMKHMAQDRGLGRLPSRTAPRPTAVSGSGDLMHARRCRRLPMIRTPSATANFPFASVRDITVKGIGGHGLPDLVCRRAGLGAAFRLRGWTRAVGRTPRHRA